MGQVRQYYMFKNGSLCEITLTNNSKLHLRITGNTWDINGKELVGLSDPDDIISCHVHTNCSLSVLSVVSQAQDLNSIYQLAPIIITLSKLKSLYNGSSDNTLPEINQKLKNIKINAHTVSCAFHNVADKEISNFDIFKNTDPTSLLAGKCTYVGLLLQHLIHILPE